MKKLWCTSFIEFEQIAIENNWDKEVPNDIAIISINYSNLVENERHICKSNTNVLNLNFDDVDPTTYGLSEDESCYIDNDIILVFFTNEMAKQVVEFIEANKNKNFYIHCSAGISRSQAIVKYIKNVYYEYDWETNPNNPCLYPNGFVFQKLKQAYRERL